MDNRDELWQHVEAQISKVTSDLSDAKVVLLGLTYEYEQLVSLLDKLNPRPLEDDLAAARTDAEPGTGEEGREE